MSNHLTARKYQAARRREKSAFLNTFTDQTGSGRKYAIHILANAGNVKPSGTRQRPFRRRLTAHAGKLFAPFLHTTIGTISAEPRFAVSAEVPDKLHRISGSTIDRLLRPVKAALQPLRV